MKKNIIIIVALFCFANVSAQSELKTEKIKINNLERYKKEHNIKPWNGYDTGIKHIFWEYNTLGYMRQTTTVEISRNEDTATIQTKKGPWRIAWENLVILTTIFVLGFNLKKDLLKNNYLEPLSRYNFSSNKEHEEAIKKTHSGYNIGFQNFYEYEERRRYTVKKLIKEYIEEIITGVVITGLILLIPLYDLKKSTIFAGIGEFFVIILIIVLFVSSERTIKTFLITMGIGWFLTIALFNTQWVMVLFSLIVLSIGFISQKKQYLE